MRTGVALWAFLFVAGCYQDLSVDADEHPCAKCKACEICVSLSLEEGGYACQSWPAASRACGEDGHVHSYDSCDHDEGRVLECLNGACTEEGDTPSCACEGAWTGESCDACPLHYDVDGGCTECLNEWQGDDCSVCPPEWSIEEDCSGRCGNGRIEPGERCDGGDAALWCDECDRVLDLELGGQLSLPPGIAVGASGDFVVLREAAAATSVEAARFGPDGAAAALDPVAGTPLSGACGVVLARGEVAAVLQRVEYLWFLSLNPLGQRVLYLNLGRWADPGGFACAKPRRGDLLVARAVAGQVKLDRVDGATAVALPLDAPGRRPHVAMAPDGTYAVVWEWSAPAEAPNIHLAALQG